MNDKIKCLNFRMAENKSTEIQWGYFKEGVIFEASFKITRKQDHAGACLHLEVFGYHFIVNFYDHRHWDYDNGRWE